MVVLCGQNLRYRQRSVAGPAIAVTDHSRIFRRCPYAKDASVGLTSWFIWVQAELHRTGSPDVTETKIIDLWSGAMRSAREHISREALREKNSRQTHQRVRFDFAQRPLRGVGAHQTSLDGPRFDAPKSGADDRAVLSGDEHPIEQEAM